MVNYLIGYSILGFIVLIYAWLFFDDMVRKLKIYRFENRKDKFGWALKYISSILLVVGWLFVFSHLIHKYSRGGIVDFIGWMVILVGVPFAVLRLIGPDKKK